MANENSNSNINNNNKQTRKFHWIDSLFLGTILFFGLSLIHISFALIGLICMIVPFLLKAATGKKLWCTHYCPRASFLVKALGKISLGKNPPKGFYSPETKQYVLMFFCVNLMMATMSTVMVGLGRIEPMAYVRFLMALRIPLELPQLLTLEVPDFITHLGFRIFSIMFSSTVVGVIIGVLYKPRTWCGICPIQTLTSPKLIKT